MEKYDEVFSETENSLIHEARAIPPNFSKIESLLKQGTDLNRVGEQRTVFLSILEYYGEYVDEQGNVRETGKYLPELIRFFLCYGLDVHAKNTDEMSVVWCFVWPTARDRYMLEAAELLLQNGAKANCRYENKTALDHLEEILGKREGMKETELSLFLKGLREVLIRYGGVPRYTGYAGWIAADVKGEEKPLLWGDDSQPAKLNRHFKYHYNERENNFDLVDVQTNHLIGRYYPMAR